MNMISYEGIGEVVATVAMPDEIKVGAPVRMKDNDQVCACTSGEVFCGIALKRNGNIGCMQVKGFVSVPYSGALQLGWGTVVANGMGGIRPDASGRPVLVTNLISDERRAVICL